MATMHARNKTPRCGLSSYIISGQIFRRIMNIRNANNENPQCIQTYFYDHQEQATQRAQFLNHGNDRENTQSRRTLELFTSIHQQLLAC